MAGHGPIRVYGVPKKKIDLECFIQDLVLASEEDEAPASGVLTEADE
jgi:hypothetical protein